MLNVNIPKVSNFDDDNISSYLSQQSNVTLSDIQLLLQSLPDYSSYIITNINDMVAELFTNVGRGTYFKISKPVLNAKNLNDLDLSRIKSLLENSFEKKLKDDYFDILSKRDPSIFVTENYSALAIVTKELNKYNYLDKFCVETHNQVKFEFNYKK